ncbi:MAG: hypothetical protein ACHQXA_08085, partial [Gemmatimonadales bacterium]
GGGPSTDRGAPVAPWGGGGPPPGGVWGNRAGSAAPPWGAPPAPLLALLTARVAAQLRDEGLSARTVTLKLRHADFTTVTRRETLPAATDLDGELTRSAIALFRTAFREARTRRQPVRLIGIAASNLSVGGTVELFEAPARTRERELTRAVDRVREKFGFDAVAPARLVRFARKKGRPETGGE